MSRRIITLVLILFLSVSVFQFTPAHAGAQRWSAWMFNSETGELLLLTDTMGGAAQSLKLPKPTSEGAEGYCHNVAISHDWHYMAYLECGRSGLFALVVYDRNASKIVVSIPLTSDSVSLNFQADESIFNEANTGLAFAYSLDQQGWEIKVLNYGIAAGAPTLRHDNPAVKALGIKAEFMLPVIRLFAANQVYFTMIRLATEGAPSYDNYVWDVTSGAVSKSDQFPSLDMDHYRPTGEFLYTVIDTRFPSCGEACSPFNVPNTLNVHSLNAPAFPFFSTAQLAIYHPTFIQNGERILVGGSANNGLTRWAVLERNGNMVGFLPDGVSIETLTGTQDGFLYLPGVVNPSGSPQLYEVNTRTRLNAGQLVWTGTQGAQVRLQQTPSNQQGKGPFLPWQQLAPQSASAPTVAPANPGVLTIGKQAIVNTTQGDKLRMRSGPGTSFPVVLMLEKDTQVTLLEGPVKADGLNWWRVATPDNAAGWVIEGINDNGTYIQTLVPA